MTTRRLIVASSSPRRAEMLSRRGYAFTIDPADVDERPRRGESGAVAAMRLAYTKASVVASRAAGGTVVLGVDTLIDLDGTPVGKPDSAQHAAEILTELSGRSHDVVSGYAVVLAHENRTTVGVEITAVRFRPVAAGEIAAYVATGEPLDKAGAYAIQAAGSAFVAAVAGSQANVAGLPLETLQAVLERYGVMPVDVGGEAGAGPPR